MRNVLSREDTQNRVSLLTINLKFSQENFQNTVKASQLSLVKP